MYIRLLLLTVAARQCIIASAEPVGKTLGFEQKSAVHEKTPGSIASDDQTQSKGTFLAGALARGISIAGMFPLDSIKTRLQTQSSHTLSSVIRAGGLYRGLAASLVGQIPYGTLTFGFYEVYKTALLKFLPKSFAYGLAAAAGDVTGALWLTPAELIKQQMQSGSQHDNLFAAARGIVKTSGIPGLYRGFMGQIMRDVPFRIVQMLSYELVKDYYVKHYQKKYASSATHVGDLSGKEGALIGAIAGSISACVTTPLDVVKTRMMTGAQSQNFMRTFLAVAREGALFKGLVTRVVYIGPSCAIFFFVFEIVKNYPDGR